ncbi:endonuclease [Winogradskyella sp. Asnod2-B02-A]|uniref:endonuclease n=1 Tax=Winogradskyella sp. Asnod2-B02-A TaxID=3160583 RepID=UPI003869B79A
MKYLYIVFLCFYSIGFSQIPSSYYDSANGLSGFTLKTELKNIITNSHIDQGYNTLFTGYVLTHSDNIIEAGYENDDTILLYYSENPNGIDSYTYNHGSPNQCGSYVDEGSCYNHESLVPQAAFSSAFPMKSDIHHITPSDGFVNEKRGDLPFGVVGNANWTSLNGTKRGISATSGYTGIVFEPIDEFKGDIARAILYFVTRYEDTVDGYTSFPMFNGTENQALSNWSLTMLLDWHYNIDPVDQREIDRNIAAYNYQGNANPFVDHPEYANMIWIDTQAPTNPINLTASNPTDNSIDLTWLPSTDNIAVIGYDIYIDSIYAFTTANTTTTINGLTPATNYCFTIKAKDAANNQSNFSDQVCNTTTNTGIGNTNCLIENFENIGVSSATYKTISWNGSDGGNWIATDARNDQTLNTKAITIRNGALTLPTTFGGIGSLTITTKLILSGTSGTFNLKVNGNMVGTIPYSDLEQTFTIPNINIENNVSIIIDGNSTATNSVKIDDLNYTCYSALGIDDFNIDHIKIYPNPVNNQLIITLKNQIPTTIEIFNILGKRVFNAIIDKTTSLNLHGLNTGVYMIKMTQNNATITKKLIKR